MPTTYLNIYPDGNIRGYKSVAKAEKYIEDADHVAVPVTYELPEKLPAHGSEWKLTETSTALTYTVMDIAGGNVFYRWCNASGTWCTAADRVSWFNNHYTPLPAARRMTAEKEPEVSSQWIAHSFGSVLIVVVSEVAHGQVFYRWLGEDERWHTASNSIAYFLNDFDSHDV